MPKCDFNKVALHGCKATLLKSHFGMGPSEFRVAAQSKKKV